MNIDNNDFIASIPSIPNIVNCAEDLLPGMLAIWGFPSYKGQQAHAITSILNGKDCFINIPTGGGKSLLYMLPAISQPGITIVIVPILALISDQLERCQQKHIPAAALYGGLPEVIRLTARKPS